MERKRYTQWDAFKDTSYETDKKIKPKKPVVIHQAPKKEEKKK